MTRMDVSMPNDPADYWTDEAIAGLAGQTPVLTYGFLPVTWTRIVAARRGVDGIELTLEMDDRVLGTPVADVTHVSMAFTPSPFKAWSVTPVHGPPAVNPVDRL
jgi:hypothetical protein